MSEFASINQTRAPHHGAAGACRADDAARATPAIVALETVPLAPWRHLAARASEPNGYYLPDWARAVSASARERSNVSALTVWHDTDTANPRRAAPVLAAVLPVVSLWRALKIPLPALVNADPYGALGTPVLDGDHPQAAARGLIEQARSTGARVLLLRDLPLDGAAMAALSDALAAEGVQPRVLRSHARACLDATRDADEILREALGPKKLKELRRQRNRLADHGEVVFRVARTDAEIAEAVEIFLTLEASGWKGQRGTALANHDGDATFIRRAVRDLAQRGECEIVSLHAGASAVAAAVVLRHRDQAFYFKLGVDERFAKLSPGVQLTHDLTRHMCADPAITRVDSTAIAGHPMIDPIWRSRLRIGDVLIPLRGDNDPLTRLIVAMLAARRKLRNQALRLVRFIRKYREQTP